MASKPVTSKQLPSQQTIELIRRLVGFDTTSSNSNLALIEFVANHLDRFGIPVRLVHSDDGNKANLLATIGPADAQGIIVSGHTDVVPATADMWTTPPFEPDIREGRIYGRGTADMKSFVAVAIRQLCAVHDKLRNPAILALSFDEELGCRGAPLLLPEVEKLAVRPAGCVVGEPTEMRIAIAHKGKLATRVHVHGRSAHSAYPDTGINAVDIAAELIVWLRHRGLEERREERLNGSFNPPFTTVHTGLVHGGTALNVVPELCSFDMECRVLPGHDAKSHITALKEYFRNNLPDDLAAKLGEARLTFEPLSAYPALATQDPEFATWAAKLADDDEDPITLSFGSEAGLFAGLGIPTVVCGPGSIHHAHRPDEFIELSQVVRSETFFEHLAEALCTGLPESIS